MRKPVNHSKAPARPRLLDFLQRNAIDASTLLPLVHTTRAFHLRSIMESNTIAAAPCDVFQGERLNYFFVGRPAYKYRVGENDEFWQLPVCFIVDFKTVARPKRVYPFDSGGFARKELPSFMNAIKLPDFEVSKDPRAIEKLVGTFFGNPRNYFRLKGKRTSEFTARHNLSPFDAEIHALHKLSIPRVNKSFDDRQFTIEVQSEGDYQLKSNHLLAVIAPITYFDDSAFLDHVEKQ
jgi:hypothetical protein